MKSVLDKENFILNPPVGLFDKSKGMLVPFNQDKIIDSLAKSTGASHEEKEWFMKRENHKLLKWGYVYYPNECV
jgi:hypothetical protein